MTERSRRDRLLATLAVWDRGRQDELLRLAGSYSEGLARELNRPAEERKPFLDKDAFLRILDALDDTDAAIARAAALLELLRWIKNHRRWMKTDAEQPTDPKEVIASSSVPDVDPVIVVILTALREQLKPSDNRAAHYDAVIEDLCGPASRELWARGLDIDLIGKRGGRRPKNAPPGQRIDRWHPFFVRSIAALVPDATVRREIAIAELLTEAGFETTHQYVSSLKARERSTKPPQ